MVENVLQSLIQSTWTITYHEHNVKQSKTPNWERRFGSLSVFFMTAQSSFAINWHQQPSKS